MPKKNVLIRVILKELERGKKLNRYDLIQKLTRFQRRKLASYKTKKLN